MPVDEPRHVVVTVNGRLYPLEVSVDERLLDTLRTRLGLYGARYGCGTGHCGACVVVRNDEETVPSCLVLTARLDGQRVTTYEGYQQDRRLKSLMDAFAEEGAAQCGYCTPGMLVSLRLLLEKEARVTEDVVRTALLSHICRCTGYYAPVRAVMKVVGADAVD
ncbi:MAG: 2Fe-2S iron-sulfur cluster-binding protein [Thermaerobacter sp.]|nr:2Fe-2S iron-sulfur cluster-binding protein [Thermaerobacter sp.]